ncbi:MAG: response regulator, partial [Candidatus Omnitrophota bacterium]
MSKVLLVDDEQQFRESLARRLNLRGYETVSAGNGVEAIQAIRKFPDIDVVLLDRKMPEMSGEQTLRELKHFRPELQIILLTGYGSLESAVEVGKMDAYSYLEKPCELEQLVAVIEDARKNKKITMERHEIAFVEKDTFGHWLLGSHNSRPGIIILGLILFVGILFSPMPGRLLEILGTPKTGQLTDINLGYANYKKMKVDEGISDYYSRVYKREAHQTDENGKLTSRPLTASETGFRAKVMLGVLVLAVLFWASGAVPIGITALLVGVCMYFFGVLEPNDIAQSYAKDAVIFVFGVLAVSSAISKTGLDRRIGLLLLGPSISLPRFLFLFLPMLAVSCSFVSEHALVAFLMPMFMMVYISTIQQAGLRQDRNLAVLFVLSLT